ncbi:WXG100 family type VII secretion target [Jatrophihabitans fulvus]
MPSLKVTPDQLATLGSTAQRVSADVRGQHQQLKAQLSPLFGADWSGVAAGQFTALYQTFDQHARGLADALDGIAALLVRAGGSYAEAEQQIAATFR